jgi:hypothetical protein
VMSDADNSKSSTSIAVINPWDFIRWDTTSSVEPCHLQGDSWSGQEHGRNSHVSSCSLLSVCRRATAQPDVEYLHGNITELANFSMLLILCAILQEVHVQCSTVINIPNTLS